MPSVPEAIQFSAYGEMDMGLHRTSMEDALFISEEEGLFIVSDGMGGAVAGSLASTIVVKTLPLELKEVCNNLLYSPETENTAKASVLGEVVDAVKKLLLNKTMNQPAAKGLGATVVVGFYVGNDMLAITHLGDSRAYLLRDATLERLTEDHTIANMLYLAGRITEEELSKHPSRNILTRHVGMQDCPLAEVSLLPLEQNDRLLFCSDGLTSMVDEETIGKMLAFNISREKAAKNLIALANRAGGHDNITVLIMDVTPNFNKYELDTEIAVRKEVGFSLLPLKKQQQTAWEDVS